MIPSTYNLPDAFQGDSYGPINFTFTDASGNPLPTFSGSQVYCEIKDGRSNNVFLNWNTNSGDINISGNVVTLLEKSGLNIPYNNYYWEFSVTSGSNTSTYLTGRFLVYKNL